MKKKKKHHQMQPHCVHAYILKMPHCEVIGRITFPSLFLINVLCHCSVLLVHMIEIYMQYIDSHVIYMTGRAPIHNWMGQQTSWLLQPENLFRIATFSANRVWRERNEKKNGKKWNDLNGRQCEWKWTNQCNIRRIKTTNNFFFFPLIWNEWNLTSLDKYYGNSQSVMSVIFIFNKIVKKTKITRSTPTNDLNVGDEEKTNILSTTDKYEI